MSHLDWCKTLDPMADSGWAKCNCHEPDTDWSPERPCGGISVTAGGITTPPPWCEVHMKPWGHRRPAPTEKT